MEAIEQRSPSYLPHSIDESIAILTSGDGNHHRFRIDDACRTLQQRWKGACAALRLRPEETEDAIQETWAKLLRSDRLRDLGERQRAGAFANPLKVDAYLSRMVRNTALDELRRRRRHAVAVESIEASLDWTSSTRTPERAFELQQDAAQAARAIAGTVAAKDLRMAWLYFAEDRSDQEIATQFGTTRAAVAGKLKRWRKALRDRLGEKPSSSAT